MSDSQLGQVTGDDTSGRYATCQLEQESCAHEHSHEHSQDGCPRCTLVEELANSVILPLMQWLANPTPND